MEEMVGVIVVIVDVAWGRYVINTTLHKFSVLTTVEVLMIGRCLQNVMPAPSGDDHVMHRDSNLRPIFSIVLSVSIRNTARVRIVVVFVQPVLDMLVKVAGRDILLYLYRRRNKR